MKGKGSGKVQMQDDQPCPRHAASGAGNAQIILDGAAGEPGDQIVGDTYKQQGFQIG